MRLKLIFGKEEESVQIEREYRKYFVSFLKSVFARSSIFSELYGNKKIKPFVFSVFLGKDFEILEEREEIRARSPFNFIFSTGDPFIFSHFYNGVIDMKKEGRGINFPGGKTFPVSEISLLNNVKITSSCAIFRTVGVCVVTDPDANAKDFEKWYCVPEESELERFNRVLEERLVEKYERLKGKKLDTQIKFTPVSKDEMEIFIRQGKLPLSFGTQPIKKVYARHYGGFVKGFKGVFYLESDPDMLQFIYDYGLGLRTGQGFGLLEVIAQI